MENSLKTSREFLTKRAKVVVVFVCKKARGVAQFLRKLIDSTKKKYGILGLIAILLVMGKLMLFYHLMNITTNVFFIWITTLMLVGILFSFFRNKWIPLILFTLLTILMFSDVTYSSYFNRYLSVGMLGAAEVLGDIGESIKEVIRPTFFLLFLDVVIIHVVFFLHKIPWRKSVIRDERT